MQAFAGSLEGHRARKGVLITTSQFSPDALDYVTRIEKKIVLIDGEKLAELMIDYGIGVTILIPRRYRECLEQFLEVEYPEGEVLGYPAAA